MPISSGLNSEIIRVGIVLPEDKIQQITISWSTELELESNVPDITTAQSISLLVEHDGIGLKNFPNTSNQSTLTLSCPDQVESLSTKYGFHIDSVVAGRGFHWEKRIEVDLPGRLEISIQDGFLKIINFVDVEAYVACVATSEMGSEAPSDLLAAQTIVARCWSLALAEAKHLAHGYDVCNDDCCQRYQGTSFLTEHSLKAAIETRGEVLVYDDKVIDARYSKNCGGMVEAYDTVWEGGKVPYLIPLWDGPIQKPGHAVDDFDTHYAYDEAYCSSKRFENVNLGGMLGKVDVSGSYYRWEQVMAKVGILKNLKKYTGLTWSSIDDIRIMERGPSARIKYLFLVGTDENGASVEQVVKSEYGIRQMFSDSFLYSSAFVIHNADTLKDDDHVVLKGVGWGHGVGLCQMGALGMALEHIGYKEILRHYYPGTRLAQLS
ncbi:MAG: SpoIID/LytB domain-containing protein [Candidatus Marinimicrobia bacterium]|nr:SpoIID/LytB domain-containing protein [Candidatus Neomarinimicrobiota bacterium]